MTTIYFLLPEGMAAHIGTLRKPNTFHAVRTADNRLVCAANTLDEFPDLFEGVEVTVLELTQADFPPIPDDGY